MDPSRRMEGDQLRMEWNRIQEKHGLPKLRMKDLRHWVSTNCRKAGLSTPASNYMQGHDPAAGKGMRDVYDNESLDDILEE
jgi:hypothetical protein